MENEINTRFDQLETKSDRLESKFDHLEQTNHKILDVLVSIKEELTEFKADTQEKFEFIIETAATKIELEQAVAKLEAKINSVESKMATKADLLHFTDLFNAKFADLRRDVVQGIRGADKKFLNFAI